MARVPNAEIGFLSCFVCGTRASLRKNSGNALYYICPLCGGPIYGNGSTFQGRCLEEATMHGEAGPPIARPAVKATEEKQPIQGPAQDAEAKEIDKKKPKPEQEEKKGDSWGFQL